MPTALFIAFWLHGTAGFEAKKMIVSCLIRRAEVCRDYKLHIDFKIVLNQFFIKIDIVTMAAQNKSPLLFRSGLLFCVPYGWWR